jgi:hypothetical protein
VCPESNGGITGNPELGVLAQLFGHALLSGLERQRDRVRALGDPIR